jgi:hypothetical protein
MEPNTKEQTDYILVSNEQIAKFMGYEKVRVGYTESDDPEVGESEWQKNNSSWIEEVEIWSVGYYWVNIQMKEWFILDDLEYYQDWNRLMGAWQKFRDYRFSEIKHQFEHGEFKQLISHSICYSSIEETYRMLVNGINWYNSTKQ